VSFAVVLKRQANVSFIHISFRR